ncbi:MAG TPA: DNA mismatch repair protein MutS [Spirochaetia bacterium]|nr:DNA mismatch repair protein MutS [Spirochaetia bacterium]
MADTTPMMSQYRRIKDEFTDSIVFFRLGDFYEMFDGDAREASVLLDLTLTQRQGVPMCGVPHHAAAAYVSRLLAAGRKVAICEQQPQAGKGMMSREVVEVVTPGTVLDEGYLAGNANNYILSLARVGDRLALAYADVSTGELRATSFPFDERSVTLRRELHRLDPREAITQESLLVEDPVTRDLLGERERLLVNRYPDWTFDPQGARRTLEKQFGVTNLKGFGLVEGAPEIVAAGALLEYLGRTARRAIGHVSTLQLYSDRTFVELDEATQRNLELLANLQDGSRKYTLLEVLDQCRTSPGARMLRRWILAPLKDRGAIEKRLSSVEALYRSQVLLSRLRDALGGVMDLERLTARLSMERAHAKDLLAIASTLRSVLGVESLLTQAAGTPGIAALAQPLAGHAAASSALVRLLEGAISDEPSTLLTEGNLIRRGYDAELDRLHGLKDNAREVLEKYLGEEKEKTGIASLKLRYNRIIGYFFEVTKSNLHLVPQTFIRRQSMVGGERYSTERLARIEEEINDASERIIEIERNLFLEVRARAREAVSWLLALCASVAELDVLQGFAFAATVRGYVRPRIGEGTELSIKDGRHPVVEAHLPGGAFIPNSLDCPGSGKFFVVLTGPNMAGKSTFLRQVALITLMAQMGSFVPASSAEIGIVDKIFCRVGASDNLARGESTFLVEMNETAHILRAASSRSLLIMDEIGRGTSTQDGLAIARAVCVSILEGTRARTLFATHFHELTSLQHPSLENLSMDVRDTDGEVVFLKRVRPGPSSNSYGIHVARLAGLPAETIRLAERFLREEEAAANADAGTVKGTAAPAGAGNPPAGGSPDASAGGRAVKPAQEQLFSVQELVARQIAGLQIDRTTPLEALEILSRLKKELNDNGET